MNETPDEQALSRILGVLQAMKRGDLSARCGPCPGSLSTLAAALDDSLDRLGLDLGRLGATSAQAVTIASHLDRAIGTLSAGAARQASAFAEITRRLQALGARSEEVGQIVELLDDVAAETNILALNAAIEASRAGAQGKGFGMVADEVRKLAERSAAATKDIGAFIETIEGAAGETTRSVHSARGLAEEISAGASASAAAAAQLSTCTRALSEGFSHLRIPGQSEADLVAALRERRRQLDRAFDGLGPLLEDPDIARSPTGDALRRLLAALAGGPSEGAAGPTDPREDGRPLDSPPPPDHLGRPTVHR